MGELDRFLAAGARASHVSIAQCHAARLEVVAVGAGGDLSVGLLAGQPHLQVEALARREARVASAQQHSAVRQRQGLQQTLRVASEQLVLLVGGLRSADLDQLHLVELVLPQHAASVSAVRAHFSSKRGAQTHHADRQIRASEQLPAEEVGDGHLCGRDEEGVVAAHFVILQPKQLFLELG